MKKTRLLRLMVLCLTVFMTFCFVSSLYAKGTPKPGGMFRYCDLKKAGVLDPPRLHQNQDVFLGTNLFNGLVNLVPGTWDIYPDLAEKYDISDDKMVYTFHLRKGVKFHHGREMTAEDVVYSLKRAMNKKYVNSARLRSVEKIEAPDKYTVRISLKRFDNIFLVKIAGCVGSGVVPREIVEKYGESFATGKEMTSGTGPYILKEWHPGRSVILEANPDYYRGRPNVDQIEMRKQLTDSLC